MTSSTTQTSYHFSNILLFYNKEADQFCISIATKDCLFSYKSTIQQNALKQVKCIVNLAHTSLKISSDCMYIYHRSHPSKYQHRYLYHCRRIRHFIIISTIQIRPNTIRMRTRKFLHPIHTLGNRSLQSMGWLGGYSPTVLE